MKTRCLLVSLTCFLIFTGCTKKESISKKQEISVSKQLTFEEIIQSYSENNQISDEESEKKFTNHEETYRIVTLYLEVNSYLTSIMYYCSTHETNDNWKIQSIDCVQLETGTKYFNGTIDSWLRSPYQIEYIINGDFYNYASSISSNEIHSIFQIDNPITFNITCYDAERIYAPVYQSGFISIQ